MGSEKGTTVTLTLSLDAVYALKQIIAKVSLSAKDPNLVESARVLHEINQSIDSAATVVGKVE